MFKSDGFSLVYFQSDLVKAREIISAGADAILVDCEYNGKLARQRGFDTQINHNNPKQIRNVSALNPDTEIMCRVNNDFGGTTEDQIEEAIVSGADSIILPMVESKEDVLKANSIIRGRANLVIMIESQTGVNNLMSISTESFAAIYVGLNDLSISRGGRPIFEPLYDGTVEHIIALSKVPVGVGGVTEPSMGSPVKSEDIIAQYARLGVSFSVLRRSFEDAIAIFEPQEIIGNIKRSYAEHSLGLVAEVREKELA